MIMNLISLHGIVRLCRTDLQTGDHDWTQVLQGRCLCLPLQQWFFKWKFFSACYVFANEPRLVGAWRPNMISHSKQSSLTGSFHLPLY